MYCLFSLLNCKSRLQNEEESILKRKCWIPGPTPTVIGLQESQQELMAKNKILIVISLAFSESKSKLLQTVAYQEMRNELPLRPQLLGFPLEAATGIPFWVKRIANERKASLDHSAKIWTGFPGLLLSHGEKLNEPTMIDFSSYFNCFSADECISLPQSTESTKLSQLFAKTLQLRRVALHIHHT